MATSKLFSRAALIVATATLAASPSLAGYELELVVGGLNKPIYATHAPGDPNGLYVVPQRDAGSGVGLGTGMIERYDLQTGQRTPFVQLTGLDADTQGGLHSLAFHPDYQPGVAGSKMYIVALKQSGESLIANNTLQEWVLDSNGTPSFSRNLIEIPGLQVNDATHAMNWAGFRPGATGDERDWLYVSIGDGGVQANESHFVNNPEDLSSIRGKVLRIDVGGADDRPRDPTLNYGFTPTIYDNDDHLNDGVPTVTYPEVYYSGLRNPWRMSFDRETGDIWIGDVGFGGYEELNFIAGGVGALDNGGQPAGQGDGAPYGIDFGWPRREGYVEGNWPDGGPRDPDGSAPRPESIEPLYAFTRFGDPESLRSITGGYVYRGPDQHPALQGKYIFGGFDFPEPKVIVADFEPDATGFGGDIEFDVITPELQASLQQNGGWDVDQVSSFAEDAEGNLYVLDFGDGCGSGCTDETGWNAVLTQFGTGQIFRLKYVPELGEGDYNNDGQVDAADYVVWRNSYGQAVALPNESITPGEVTDEDFEVWRAMYGTSWSPSSVPEPTAIALALIAGLSLAPARRS